ncbi:hypothetical protein BO85DRAFT_381844, partial [Aspergillus piperis CBS 112811]
QWKKIKYKKTIYYIFNKIQASAVPVFLEIINLIKFYFIYKAGKICYIFIII